MPSLVSLSSLILAMGSTGLAQYTLVDDYFDGNFFDKFTFWEASDPTNGFVDYQSREDSQAAGLIESSPGNIFMGADSTNVTPGGRPAVRIESNAVYDNGLIIIDVDHMPWGCGTWPAFWTYGPVWPDAGELDIIEGVNEQESNSATLHTTATCTIEDNGLFTGQLDTDNCDINAPDQAQNAGCSIGFFEDNSYGDEFNQNGGGIYATEWTDDYISVWFFPRGDIPYDVIGESPDPSTWGQPQARFEGNCDIPDKIYQQKLVFTNTFCGDWAGNVWPTSSCASRADTCQSFVENNPEAFENAFWSVNALRVYQNENGEVSTPTVPAGPTSTTVEESVTTIVPEPTTSTIVENPTTTEVTEIPPPLTTSTIIDAPTTTEVTELPPPLTTSTEVSTIAPVPTSTTSTAEEPTTALPSTTSTEVVEPLPTTTTTSSEVIEPTVPSLITSQPPLVTSQPPLVTSQPPLVTSIPPIPGLETTTSSEPIDLPPTTSILPISSTTTTSAPSTLQTTTLAPQPTKYPHGEIPWWRWGGRRKHGHHDGIVFGQGRRNWGWRFHNSHGWRKFFGRPGSGGFGKWWGKQPPASASATVGPVPLPSQPAGVETLVSVSTTLAPPTTVETAPATTDAVEPTLAPTSAIEQPEPAPVPTAPAAGDGVDWDAVDWDAVDWSAVDWNAIDWSAVDWDSVDWDSVDWSSVDWDNVDWSSVNWDNVDWDSVNWDNVDWDAVDWDGVDWDAVDWDSVDWESVDYSKRKRAEVMEKRAAMA
ncbi:hypothetical protein MBLNU230_g3803t1 [Neophaeotheca triangularis]